MTGTDSPVNGRLRAACPSSSGTISRSLLNDGGIGGIGPGRSISATTLKVSGGGAGLFLRGSRVWKVSSPNGDLGASWPGDGVAVRWISTNYGSNDMLDNIFVEDPWHADTDSFVSGDLLSPTDWNAPPEHDYGLTLSYEAYPDLQPGR